MHVGPHGQVLAFGTVSAVATDSQDRVYAFQRAAPPVLVFDRDGNFLSSWGNGAFVDPHGIYIADDIIYLTDREGSVAMKYTLDGNGGGPLRHPMNGRTFPRMA